MNSDSGNEKRKKGIHFREIIQLFLFIYIAKVILPRYSNWLNMSGNGA